MKKWLALVLTVFFAFSFAACNDEPAEKVTIQYYSQASDMLPAMKAGQLATGLLPEPAATRITTMNSAVSMKIDIQQIYGGDYPQAVLVAKKSVFENDSEFLSDLLTAMEKNAEWISENDGNAASAVDAINSALAEGVTPSLSKDTINKAVVENCNIYLQLAADAKTSVNEYLEAMRGVDADAASSVADGFFATLPETTAADADVSYEIYMPDGAPALAMAQLIKDDAQFGRTVNYTVVAASNIGPAVVQKKADVAILPVTAASKIIGSGEEYVMLGVVTHGNIYVMSSEDLSSLQDLCGKTIGVIGQGQVPDLTFRYLLNKNGIEYQVAE